MIDLRALWGAIFPPVRGSADDGRCALCGQMVTPADRVHDEATGNAFCSTEHYLEGLAERW
ncbi:hypothetical protein DEJ16_12595 [Curtobacterium sp. MCJR17_055]|uniref:hypothetical protein n=1 Tax=unclassified Curtobacterium TaxID=257496 RepID=UPI000D839947|nr:MULTISPECIES: hypothetical protein [unclassified Curtobacterium]PYY34088.1 hypothetical protein DEI87_10020 [Curtobacterium sp. MCBD17_029]PYY53938.1 hypothetical protein DEJ16_12595 [Curtobacterium sp. MCJR17_055]PYY59175.1 hypothetical protein DEJ26_09220 [Curtobacterium sp. MCPF17_015]WIB34815.1 hypothetical protein DEJ15_09555 [Curtobacterium sp. MCJR17_043]